MKRLASLTVIFIVISSLTSISARGVGTFVCFVPLPLTNDVNSPDWIPGYYETKERTYRKNSCRAGYRKLKKEMKKEARNLCKNRYDSPKWNPLKCIDFRKISCVKTRRPHHQTTVKVKATLNVNCR